MASWSKQSMASSIPKWPCAPGKHSGGACSTPQPTPTSTSRSTGTRCTRSRPTAIHCQRYRASTRFCSDRGSGWRPWFRVATVTVSGSLMEPMRLPEKLIQLPDLSHVEIAQQREIIFQENMIAPVFTINGAAFDPDIVNTTVKLGTTEEWILCNTSPDAQPFHIHVEDFQVMSINGAPQAFSYQDTVNLPPRSSVVIRIPFLDFTGKFVYHCHILAHEDFGMMSVIEVVE